MLNASSRNLTPTGNVHQLRKELREFIGGLVAGKVDGVSYKVKSAKELVIKFREGCDKLNLDVYPVEITTEVDNKWGTKKNKRTGDIEECLVGSLVTALYTIRYVSLSDSSYVDTIGIGQGLDSADKAGGKSFTYGWKMAAIYGLILPDKEIESLDPDRNEFPLEERVSIHSYITRANECATLEQFNEVAKEMKAEFTPDECIKVAPMMLAAKKNIEDLLKVEGVVNAGPA